MKHYDVIVLGCGGLGSAVLYWLARAGANVLGLEQFEHGHEKGSSHDHSRIIRLSYDGVAYARLAPHSYACWSELEAESGIKLVYKTGGIDFGPAENNAELQAVIDTMKAVGTPFEIWTPEEAMRHFPQFTLPENVQVVYQADTGLVDARQATQAHALMAKARGAKLLEGARVTAITSKATGLELKTTQGAFSCGKLILATGPWLGVAMQILGKTLPITVTREQLSYFKSPNLRDFAIGRFPVWIWYGNREHSFYGFPVYGEVAVKAAEDLGGQVTDPDHRSFAKDERSDKTLHHFLSDFIPSMLGPELYTKTCLYDMPPDRNFILDFLPGEPNILVADGAGHGFKFASLIGKIMTDLALEGKTPYDLSQFSFDRPALSDPAFKAVFKIQDSVLTEWFGK